VKKVTKMLDTSLAFRIYNERYISSRLTLSESQWVVYRYLDALAYEKPEKNEDGFLYK